MEEETMDTKWLRERLAAVRSEADSWPEWRKRELEVEVNKTPKKEPEEKVESRRKSA
jgi:hypothetical protein